MINNYYGWEPDFEPETLGIQESDANALRYAWGQFLDFAYSPYKPDVDELHCYMQHIGKILGEMPPEAMPFSGTQELNF